MSYAAIALVASGLPSWWIHRHDPDYRTLGASGAVSAVLFAYILLDPWAKLYLYFAIPIPALLFAVYPLLHAALAMGICSVLLGASLGSVQPMIMSMLHQITPEHRHGEAVAMRVMAINASSVTMPLLFGVAGSVIGIAGVFWTVGAVVGSGIRLALRLKEAPTAH